MSRIKDLVIETENARQQCKHLSWESALVAAQSKMKAVAKDSTNNFHKYAYASADDVIAAARIALNGEGLAVIRTWSVAMNESGMWVTSQFSLVHDGSLGVFSAGSVPFPVIEDKGRPLDKALAGALTTSLSYFLRDLLLIPKQDDDGMDKRDDTRHVPAARTIQPSKLLLLGLSGAVALNKRLREHELSLADLMSAMNTAMGQPVPTDPALWQSAWMKRIDVWIANRLVTDRKEQDETETITEA